MSDFKEYSIPLFPSETIDYYKYLHLNVTLLRVYKKITKDELEKLDEMINEFSTLYKKRPAFLDELKRVWWNQKFEIYVEQRLIIRST